MIWLLTVLLWGAAPQQVAVGTLSFTSEAACEAKIAELKAAPMPDTVSFEPVAAQAKCEEYSNPITEKSVESTP